MSSLSLLRFSSRSRNEDVKTLPPVQEKRVVRFSDTEQMRTDSVSPYELLKKSAEKLMREQLSENSNYKHLEEKLQSSEKLIVSQSSAIEKLTIENIKLVNVLNAEREQYNRLNFDLLGTQTICTTLSNSVDCIRDAIGESNQDRNQLHLRIQEIELLTDKLSLLYEQTSKENTNLKSTNASVKQQLADREMDLGQKDLQISHLNSEIEMQKQANNNLIRKIEEINKKFLDGANSWNAEREQLLKKLSSKQIKLELQAKYQQELKEENKVLETAAIREIACKNATVKELKKQLDDTKASLIASTKNSEATIELMNHKQDDVEKQLIEKSVTIREKEACITVLLSEKEELEKSESALNKKLLENISVVDKIQMENHTLIEESKKLAAQLENEKSRCANYIEEKNSCIDTLEVAADNLRNELNIIKHKYSEIEEANKIIKDSETNLQKAQVAITEEYRININRIKDTCKSLEEKLSASQSEWSKLKSQEMRMKEEISILQTEKDRALESNEQMKEQIKQLNENHMMEIKKSQIRFQQQLEESVKNTKNSIIRDFSDQVSKLKNQIENKDTNEQLESNFKEEIAKQNAELQRAQETIEEMKKSMELSKYAKQDAEKVYQGNAKTGKKVTTQKRGGRGRKKLDEDSDEIEAFPIIKKRSRKFSEDTPIAEALPGGMAERKTKTPRKMKRRGADLFEDIFNFPE